MENLSLKEGQESFKMVITDYVEAKIRHLLKKFPSTEWSGILFYKYTGSIENKDLEVTCEDILLMNIGTGGYTQFEENASIIGYMVDNDLMDCEYGLIHSHHSMATFFSGEDKNTLMVDGADRNNFVSLIVNNAGTYTAKITSKEQCKAKVSKYITIPFFGTENHREESTEYESTVVTYYDLKITIGKTQYDFSELDSRIEELKPTAGKFEANERSAWNSGNKPTITKGMDIDDIFLGLPNKSIKTSVDSQLSLNLGLDIPISKGSDFDADIEYIDIDENVVNATVAQLVSGLVTASRVPSNIDSIARRFESRFRDEEEMHFVVDNYVTLVIESMVGHIEDPSIPEDIKMSNLAIRCYDEVSNLKLDYPYVTELLDQLMNYAYN